MSTGKPIGAKLFLEGIEVPFIGATITSTVNTASIAYVDLIPHKEINNIKPRTHVVIAVRDYTNPEDDYPFVHAWEGEVFGYNFGRSTSGRNFTLQCIDLTGYWDNVLTYFINIMHSLGKGLGLVQDTSEANAAEKGGIAKRIFTMHSNASYLKQTMSKALDKDGSDLLDGFIALYESISGINDFYNLAEQRFRIKDRIVAHSSKNLNKLLQGKESLDWLESIASRTTGYQTLRTVIQDLMSIILHDYVTVPIPARVNSRNTLKKPLKKIKEGNQTIGSFIFKPNIYMIPPPACNIFFPDEYSSFQFSRNFFQEPTRMHYRPELPRSLSLGLVLPHEYQPDSYADFMYGTKFNGVGVDATSSDGQQGAYGETDKDGVNSIQKREYSFLSEEEKLKGIFLSVENMMPATTQYATSVQKLGNGSFAKDVAKYLFAKKRYETRQLQITSHLKLSVAPGCPVLILDDSDSDQNIAAYCSSVTHRIYATEGGHTTVSLSYARNISENDISSNRGSEPPLPPWFKDSVFGTMSSKATSKSAAKEVQNRGVQYVSADGLSNFYKAILGEKGSTPITNMKVDERTMVGSVRAILKDYSQAKAKGSEALQQYISKITARDYVKLRDAFDFIGAQTQTKDLRFDQYVEFRGDSYQAKGRTDEKQNKEKRAVIERYRQALKDSKGFKG